MRWGLIRRGKFFNSQGYQLEVKKDFEIIECQAFDFLSVLIVARKHIRQHEFSDCEGKKALKRQPNGEDLTKSTEIVQIRLRFD